MSVMANVARWWGRLDAQWLRPAGSHGLVWSAVKGSAVPSDHVWCTAGWGAHVADRDVGALFQIELLAEKRRVGVVQLRELWVPGIYRYWDVLSEPDCMYEIPQADMLEALVAFAKANHVDHIRCFSNMARWTGIESVDSLGVRVEPFGTYVMDLGGDLESLRAGLHPEHRRLMTRGEQAGIRMVDGIEPKEFQELLDEAYAKTDRHAPYGGRYIYNLLQHPQVPRLVVCAMSMRGPEAVGLCVYGANHGFYLHGGSRAKPLSGATILVQFGIMERLQAMGVKRYDLGGARLNTTDERLHGIERFKRRFGGPYVACSRWEWKRR